MKQLEPIDPVSDAATAATPTAPRAFDAAAINETIHRALTSAGLDTSNGPMREVTETIRRALSSRGGATAADRERPGDVIDLTAEIVPATGFVPAPGRSRDAGAGEFSSHTFRNDAGERAYKLYLPSSYDATSGLRVPMVMMLHGCTQSPDDFATGTRMNALAERHGFLVVYPAQSTGANASRCWSWFEEGHQHRDRGEPSILAGITREVTSTHLVDPRRVFVAGMSAGAAMAVVLATTYPDLYAAVGAHSGLPYGVASDMPSALAAMRRGSTPAAAVAATASADARRGVPTITFHGDRDTTVNVRNSGGIVGHALAGRELQRQMCDAALAGRGYERVCYTESSGAPVIEQWTLRGAGHAWSGGNAAGSFTDAGGPDASAEMVRFFLAQPTDGVR